MLDDPEVDPERVVEVARRARRSPPEDPEEGRRLLDALQHLTHRARTRLKAISSELRKAGSSRRALRGYGHLKSTHTGQRANRVA